jgi:hypothetical protein
LKRKRHPKKKKKRKNQQKKRKKKNQLVSILIFQTKKWKPQKNQKKQLQQLVSISIFQNLLHSISKQRLKFLNFHLGTKNLIFKVSLDFQTGLFNPLTHSSQTTFSFSTVDADSEDKKEEPASLEWDEKYTPEPN